MAFERQAVAAMSNPEAARAWLEASRMGDAAFLNFCAVISACEENDRLDFENQNLAEHIARMNDHLNRSRRSFNSLCFIAACLAGGQVIALWGAVLAVLK